jgi:cytochrome c oxidase subunit II
MMHDPEPATFQLPEQLSTAAEQVDRVYYFIYWLSVVLFCLVVGMMVYFAWKYRATRGHKPEPTGHNVPLEVAWTIAPLLILALLFHWGFRGYMFIDVAPADAMEIRVNAHQWGWEFVYPNGGSDDKLHAPVHKPVKLIMGSADVIHDFYVPALRVKRDVVPGMFTSVWFEATHTGTDDIFCAQYCGGRSKVEDANGDMQELPFDKMTGHWSMRTQIVIQEQPDFDKYMEKLGNPCLTDHSATCLATWGNQLRAKKGCTACHSPDGTPGVGPSWKGIWGKQEGVTVGGAPTNVLVDENYVRESILDPNAKVVNGFKPVMPTFKGQISDQEIDAIMAYIKSLKGGG